MSHASHKEKDSVVVVSFVVSYEVCWQLEQSDLEQPRKTCLGGLSGFLPFSGTLSSTFCAGGLHSIASYGCCVKAKSLLAGYNAHACQILGELVSQQLETDSFWLDMLI